MKLRWFFALAGLIIARGRGLFIGYILGWMIESVLKRMRNAAGNSTQQQRSQSRRSSQGYARDEGKYQRSYQQNHFPSWVDPLEEAYRILGVSPSASDEEVRQAYRRLALMYHPDRMATRDDASRQQAEKMFQVINQAHDRIWLARGMK